MSAKVSEIIDVVDKIAPFELALEGDNVGLQVGEGRAGVTRVLLALDPTSGVIEEAVEKKADLIISHHPLIYQNISTVADSTVLGKSVLKLLRNNISLLVAHTNLDRSPGGVNDVLAEVLGLRGIRPLAESQDLPLYKMVVFVPASHLKGISQAIADKGAGRIGDYTHCSFRIEGQGTFKPGKEAKPTVGEKGKINVVDEVRLEVTVGRERLQDVKVAMLEAHPYEEVAYDVYRLENSADYSFGKVGTLSKPVSLKDFVEVVRKKLDAVTLRYVGNAKKTVSKVAVSGGSGSVLIEAAKGTGAQVFVSGDIKYHAALHAQELGLAVIDAGHGTTERVIVSNLAKSLRKEFTKQGLKVSVLRSDIDTRPWSK